MKSTTTILLIALLGAGAFFIWQTSPQSRHHKILIQADDLMAAKGAVSPFSVMPLRSVPGNYLAARFAVSNDDLRAASGFYENAIAAAPNKEVEQFLLDRTLPALIGSGDIPAALKIARKMDVSPPTLTAQLAVLLQVIDGFKRNDAKETTRLLGLLRDNGFNRLLKPLLESWDLAGHGDYAQAVTQLEKLAKDYPSLQPMAQMHLAFIYDMQGDNTKAETYYHLAQTDHLSLRSAYLIGQFYEHQHNKAAAIKLYQELGKHLTESPLPQIAIQRLQKDELHDTTSGMRKASDGVAAALYDVASFLDQENSSALSILYAQMAHYLNPKDEFTTVLLGDILAKTTVPSQAETYFSSVPQDSDLYVLAQMRLAQLYEQQDQSEKALGILQSVAKNPLTEKQAFMALGDFYRRKEDFVKAIPYYDKILAMTPKLVENDWVILYARAICYERTNEWDKAEADLVQALKLSPQQPEVLNYLAYSWADHGKNLPKSLEMLQEAMAGAPGDPYIADSVGWALYKIGHTSEALSYMEAAIQELPDDPTLNSHLGDIYWRLDRRLEAQFQWERALKNTKDTDPKAKAELQQRLDNGLPKMSAQNPVSTAAGS